MNQKCALPRESFIIRPNIFGNQRLVAPNTPLDVRGRVGAGDVNLFGQQYDGVRVDVRRTYGSTATPGAPGLLTLDLEVALGQVEVSS